MNSDIAISVEGLGKKYLIGHERERERYVALRDVMTRVAKNAWRKTADMAHGREIIIGDTVEEFWALKDVSFELKRGEVLGIIGRNGAGKSTLLKILSRITEPSEGYARINGRVASLLEVGTGFHPELTGRENIYLNGAILGMTRAEIKSKFDQIVAFAEIEKFLDTPVKRYSSGMYVRLAFAVAAHLETDIMAVDEVLAVGDAEFQRKCLGKMSNMAAGGRSVFFVSHNLGAIRRLTERCLVLSQGRIVLDAPTAQAIEFYLKQSSGGTEGGIFERPQSQDRGQPFFVHRVTCRKGSELDPTDQFDCDQPILLFIDYSARRKVPGLYGYLVLQSTDGTIVYEGDSIDSGNNQVETIEPGKGTFIVRIPPRVLGPGTYQIWLSFASPTDIAGPQIDVPEIVGHLKLSDCSTRRGNNRRGFISAIVDWQKQ